MSVKRSGAAGMLVASLPCHARISRKFHGMTFEPRTRIFRSGIAGSADVRLHDVRRRAARPFPRARFGACHEGWLVLFSVAALACDVDLDHKSSGPPREQSAETLRASPAPTPPPASAGSPGSGSAA